MVVYENMYNERISIPKSDPRNYVFKICLNTAYGLSKEENSYFYDPKFTYTITINGQLLLLKLMEMLFLSIPNIVFYQVNTDGITMGYDEKYKYQVKEIYNEFMNLTQLELEYAYYQQMNIVDVNNYSAKTTSGEIKRKGLFGYIVPKELDYHKNPSFLIIPRAIDEYLFNGIDYKYTINNSTNIKEFLGAIKQTKDFVINIHSMKQGIYTISKQEKVCRYYLAKTGGTLVKNFHDGRVICFHDKLKVESMNTLREDVLSNINRTYYIGKTREIIHALETRDKNILLNLELNINE